MVVVVEDISEEICQLLYIRGRVINQDQQPCVGYVCKVFFSHQSHNLVIVRRGSLPHHYVVLSVK